MRLACIALAGCAAAPSPRMVAAHERESRPTQASTSVAEPVSPATLAIDLDALPWLGEASSFPDAEVTLKISHDDAGWHVSVSGVPSLRPGETEASFIGWEPAIPPRSCDGAQRWHAIDDTLVYQRGEGVFGWPRCTVRNVHIEEVQPVPILNGLFLAFRRRCADDCATLVLLGPALFDVMGTTPIERAPRSIVELPLDRGSGASVYLDIDGKQARELGSAMKGDVIRVALEVAFPNALARITAP